MTIGQVGEALVEAGILTPALRLRKIVRQALSSGRDPQGAIVTSGDVEAALTLANPRDVALSLKKLVQELERDGGLEPSTGNGLTIGTPVRSTETAEGQSQNTDAGRGFVTPDSEHDQDEAGQAQLTESQALHTRFRPGHAKQRSPEALAANTAVIAKSVLDTFAVIGRNGERLPIGDIRISSYGRIINMTRKRSWRASREHNLMVLLKDESERKAAFIPDDAKTRDIFDADSVQRMLVMATTMAFPPGSDTAAQDAAA